MESAETGSLNAWPQIKDRFKSFHSIKATEELNCLARSAYNIQRHKLYNTSLQNDNGFQTINSVAQSW